MSVIVCTYRFFLMKTCRYHLYPIFDAPFNILYIYYIGWMQENIQPIIVYWVICD